MPITRVFGKAIRFTFRTKKRFFVFLLIFGIVSTLIAFYIDDLDSLQTDDLLDQKGVVVKRAEGANITYTQGHQLFEDIIEFADDEPDTELAQASEFLYADIDPTLRLNSIDIENPWMSDFADPGIIESGSFPTAPHEVLIPDGASQIRTVSTSEGPVIVETKLAVGQELVFTDAEGNEETLEIVGTVDPREHDISNRNDQLWLYLDDGMYEDMLNFFDMDIIESNVYMLSFIVEGLILQESTYEKVNVLADHITELLEDSSTYGNFQDVPDSLPLQQTLQKSNEILVALGFVVIGGVILSTLFAYLITRFRRREIAILKAMGWSNNSVRASLVAELLTVSFLGFFFGLGLAQGLLIYFNSWEVGNFLRLQAVGYSFLIMVVIALPGMLLASRRVLGVSPAEAFRDN